VIVYERAGLLFVFNFHPSKSFTDYRVGVEEDGEYKIVLSSDERNFGGFDNIALDGKYFTTPMEWNGRKNWLQVCPVKSEVHLTDKYFVEVYIPTRTCVVLAK
jgi:1,4-alpha-glucan branching enzyme